MRDNSSKFDVLIIGGGVNGLSTAYHLSKHAGLKIGLVERFALGHIHGSPQGWFDPIFKELDKAVFDEKKTLIHCQAGVSRSATIVAAYLISRFGVTSDQAIAYLRTKRLCGRPQVQP